MSDDLPVNIYDGAGAAFLGVAYISQEDFAAAESEDVREDEGERVQVDEGPDGLHIIVDGVDVCAVAWRIPGVSEDEVRDGVRSFATFLRNAQDDPEYEQDVAG